MTKKKSKQNKTTNQPRNMANQQPNRRRRRRNEGLQNPGRRPAGHIRVNGSDATLVVAHEELAYTVTSQKEKNKLVATNRINFWPGKSGLTRLDQFGRMYDQYRVRKLVVKYLTASGTVTSGSTITGIDYDASDYPGTLGALQVNQPKLRVPVWESGSMRLDIDRLNKSRWMFTSAGIATSTPGFTSACAVTSSAPASDTEISYGEVWVDYEVVFTGPSLSNASGQFAANSSAGSWNTNESTGTDDIMEVVNTADKLNIRPQTKGVYNISVLPGKSATDDTFWDKIESYINPWGVLRTLMKNKDIAEYEVDVLNRITTTWLPSLLGITYGINIRRIGGSGPAT